MWNEVFPMSPTVNLKAFDSLPEDLQKVIIDSFIEVTQPGSDFMKWMKKTDEEAIKKIKENKPTMTFYELTDEEVVPFKELARQDEATLNQYFKLGGDGSELLYNTLLADIEALQ